MKDYQQLFRTSFIDYDSLLEFYSSISLPKSGSVAIQRPKMRVLSFTETQLLTIGVDIPLHIPPWPKLRDIPEKEVIRNFNIQNFLSIEVLSLNFKEGAE